MVCRSGFINYVCASQSTHLAARVASYILKMKAENISQYTPVDHSNFPKQLASAFFFFLN